MSWSHTRAMPTNEMCLYWSMAQSLMGTAPWEPCEVLLQGVPEVVCSNALFVEAMLEQAGLEWAVRQYEVKHQIGRETGDVLVTLTSKNAAHQCLRVFSDCQWGADRRIHVRARLMKPDKTPSRFQKFAREIWVEKSTGDSTVKTSNEAYTSWSSDLQNLKSAGADEFDALDSDQATTLFSELSVKADDSDSDPKLSSLGTSATRTMCWADLSDDDF